MLFQDGELLMHADNVAMSIRLATCCASAAASSITSWHLSVGGQGETDPLTLQLHRPLSSLGIRCGDCWCRARDWVANSLNYTRPVTLSLFEANIRIVGGLLSAHDFSGDRIFLQRAQELVEFMMPNFLESPLGKVCFLLPLPSRCCPPGSLCYYL